MRASAGASLIDRRPPGRPRNMPAAWAHRLSCAARESSQASTRLIIGATSPPTIVNVAKLFLLEPLDLGGSVNAVVSPLPRHGEIGIAGGRSRLFIGETLVEHASQGLGVTLGDGKDHGLAPV